MAETEPTSGNPDGIFLDWIARGTAPRGFIDLDSRPDEFVVETDGSFPVEAQAGDALADQLPKLDQLLGQGVLTAEE